MRSRLTLLSVLTVTGLVALVAACGEQEPVAGPLGPAGPAGPVGPPGPSGEDATAAQEYVGSDTCADCHQEQYDTFVLSGHPYKLTAIENGQPPSFPYDSVTGGVTDPPAGYTWDDIAYVIGGFGWKVRFIDQDGYIITGDADATTQYNFANEDVEAPAAWVAYHAGEQKPYDCGRCHTTGYQPEGHQNAREGIIGTWAFPGIQCEACHGPGSLHAVEPFGVGMKVEYASQLCGQCHVRGDPAFIDGSGGFERHHQQYDDLYNSKHFAISCVACHDPHASSLFEDEELNPNAGIRQTCDSCHWAQARRRSNPRHFIVKCTDCHMPPMAKSAQANLEIFTGDVRSHQFSINPDPEAPQFSEDGSQVMPYITLQYACGQCHNGIDFDRLELEVMAATAQGYHDPPTPTPVPTPEPEPEETPEAPEATPTPGG